MLERSYRYDPRGLVASDHRELSGLELLEQIVDGRIPLAPMAATLDFRVTGAARGRVRLEGRPAVAFYNFTGTVQGGWAAALLDAALGLAVLSGLGRGHVATTTELSIRYVRPITAATGTLAAEGVLVHLGRRLGTAEARLVGLADGRLYAHGATSCLVVED
jgi:uncharacterized protein (TIGR00369 family)